MTTSLFSSSTNWTLPSYSQTLESTLPNYEKNLPIRVKGEGATNYAKNRGSLKFGDEDVNNKRISIPMQSIEEKRDTLGILPRRVKGSDAERNYLQGRQSTPNLLYSSFQPPNPHHGLRVKTEARANYQRNQYSEMRLVFDNDNKSTSSIQTMPREVNISTYTLFYSNFIVAFVFEDAH